MNGLSCVYCCAEDGEYMSFGISGDPVHSQMVGGDVAVAYVDQRTLKGDAVDYYLDAKSQCAGVRGSCPDERFVVRNNIFTVPLFFFVLYDRKLIDTILVILLKYCVLLVV